MKKLLLFTVFLLLASVTQAQNQPRAALYGITDTFVAATRLKDSLENASPMSIVKVENAVVRGFTIIHNPVNGTPFVEQADGKTVSSQLRARLKNARPGDRVLISNIKVFTMGRETVIRSGTVYMLQ